MIGGFRLSALTSAPLGFAQHDDEASQEPNTRGMASNGVALSSFASPVFNSPGHDAAGGSARTPRPMNTATVMDPGL